MDTLTTSPSLTEQIDIVFDLIIEDHNHDAVYRAGQNLFNNGMAQVLSQSASIFEISVDDDFNDFRVSVNFDEKVAGNCTCKSKDWCRHRVAALMQVKEVMTRYDSDGKPEGKQYTRDGMIKRVLAERNERAARVKYKVSFSDNAYGEHTLINEKGKKYKITFRDLKNQQGYCSCDDYNTNKLGTCKHLLFAFAKNKKSAKNQPYPFIDVHIDPLREYRIAWYNPEGIPADLQPTFNAFFDADRLLKPESENSFLHFLKDAGADKRIYIRKEVFDALEMVFNERMIAHVKSTSQLDFSSIKAELYPYQKEGVTFALFKQGAVIADEMGLGKTIQAIATAVLKKQLFGFAKTLVICPASLKAQWKNEIEKFTDEKAEIVEGPPHERAEIYRNSECFFLIINYETVLRDSQAINKADFDFIILDEAQRIKNFETLTANAVKSLKKQHSLVITGTPIENRLTDLFSIIGFVDRKLLGPLWEFSYQHCYFDHDQTNKITGYYNLRELKEKLSPVLLRREKQDVLEQLHSITHLDVAVDMHPIQQDYHASSAMAIANILRKKFKTPLDMQMLTMHLQNMRMACDSSFLIDKETNHSPKLAELEDILLNKLNLLNNSRKVIIFSEWKRMNHIIGKMLSKNGIGYTELNGSVPVKARKKLIQEFEENQNCRVFLSTEAGGSGLNLQFADTVINFELPWNPAKKNQRIGRIDRLGQKSKSLTVVNLITRNSIEMKIASGLMVKQNLFDGVLSPESGFDVVDFSEKGRSQFLKQLEESMAEFMAGPALAQEFEMSDELQDAIESDSISAQVEQENIQAKVVQSERIRKLEEMETVMNKGMEFLAGMFKMATGTDLATGNNSIKVDKETGEVVMRFKVDF